MTFLAPWAAWFLAGVPVIVLLYLLKLKRRPVAVSTLLFWQRVMQENRQRALFQKLRNLFSLLLHLLIFLLIVAALAKPALDRRVREGASLVLIVDTRARMQAVESGTETRFTRALTEARKFAREAGPGRQLALLTAGASPNVIVPFTSDERALLQGLDSLAVTDAAGDLEASLALADSLLASRKGDARIVVLTDAEKIKSEIRNQKSEMSFVACGSARDNIAITRFATRPLPASPQTSEVLLAIKNFGRATVSGNVEISFDGKLLDVKPFTLEPGKERFEVFASVPRPTRGGRGWLTARLDGKDALAADNTAYAVLPAPEPHRVLLVTKGNWFLEKLLAADRQVQFELIEPAAWQADFAAKFDAVILDNFIPPSFDLATSAGNVLFLKQSPFTTGDAPLAQPLVSESDALHPLLRLVSLQNVTIVRAAAAKLPDAGDGWAWQAPLRSFEHPLLIVGERRSRAGAPPAESPAGAPPADRREGSAGEAPAGLIAGGAPAPLQRIAALAFDVSDSDLPLRIAFPLLMSNAVHWLAGEASETLASVIAGENVALAAGASISTEPLTSPDAKTDAAKFAGDVFQPLRNGFYQLQETGGAGWLAVNTFSQAESDLRGAGTPAAAPAALPLPGLAAFTGWPLWQHLALAALALFTIEWWLFHRRRTE